MATEPEILYLEPDDEITSVVRRVRETDAPQVILVAPGRTRATSSAVALRLLAGVAAEDGRSLALVADPLGRTLAAEAGIPSFATVADARGGVAAVDASPAPKATIHVVRADETAAVPIAAASEETRPVRIVPPPAPRAAPPRRPPPGRPGRPRRRGIAWLGVAILLGALVAAGAVAAAVLPAATIRIRPETRPVGPLQYTVTPDPQHVSGQLELTMSGKARGEHIERSPAQGTVLFQSGNPGRCRVPAGTTVMAGDSAFTTDEDVTVPEGKLTGRGIKPGSASVGITAVEPGEDGNVDAHAIDTIADPGIRFCLRGFPNTTHRLVDNPDPTSGGSEEHIPVVRQPDVDRLRARITDALATQLHDELATHQDLLTVEPAQAPTPDITVPDDLVGQRGEERFELTGTLAYDYPAVERSAIDEEARQQLSADSAAVPSDATLLPDTIDDKVGEASLHGDEVRVEVTVTAQAAPSVDMAALRQRVKGLSPDQAEQALANIGPAEVSLWPGWVTTVPGADWRISIELVGTDSG